MSMVVITYVLYLVISILVTIWVGKTLYKNGRVFLVDAFSGNGELAGSVNHLLVVGFYLVNVGFVALAIKLGLRPGDAAAVVETISLKVGTVLVVLGAMHFFNLYVLARIRRRGLLRHDPPPVQPMSYLRPPDAFYGQPAPSPYAPASAAPVSGG